MIDNDRFLLDFSVYNRNLSLSIIDRISNFAIFYKYFWFILLYSIYEKKKKNICSRTQKVRKSCFEKPGQFSLQYNFLGHPYKISLS